LAKQTKKLPSAVPVANDLIFGGWNTCTVAAAMELDVFTVIAHGKTSANEIAGEAHANESMMRRLLDTLVALKYLTRKGDRYALSQDAATFLVRGGDLYMEGAGRFANGQMTGWFQLADVVRNGAPLSLGGDDAARAEFFAMLVKVIFPLNFVGATAAVASLGAGAKARIKNILDVAAGAGAWSIPFAQAIRAAHVTAVDFPQVTPVARDYAKRFGVQDKYEYREGDLREMDLGTDCYDLVTLGHIIHGEGRDAGRRLLERSAKALRQRGMLLIAELVPNDDRTGPAMPMLFGLNMMLHTEAGDVFTMKEYRTWLKEAGFKTVKTIRTPAAPSPLILATK
jgi:3-hydroxy-5-methyl-1-naphthoate 3-O-methyltransferase